MASTECNSRSIHYPWIANAVLMGCQYTVNAILITYTPKSNLEKIHIKEEISRVRFDIFSPDELSGLKKLYPTPYPFSQESTDRLPAPPNPPSRGQFLSAEGSLGRGISTLYRFLHTGWFSIFSICCKPDLRAEVSMGSGLIFAWWARECMARLTAVRSAVK